MATSELPAHITPFDDVQRQYLEPMIRHVRERAEALAHENDRTEINYVDAVKAFEGYFGNQRPVAIQNSWASENAFLVIITAMTLIFGAMGLLPYIFSPTSPDKFGFKPEAFLDMAKLFAGVIVGGAAGATAATATSRRVKNSG